MRSSDWSSDVCSSDLLAHMSLQFGGRVSKQRGQRPEGELHLCASHVGTSIIGLRGERFAPPNRFALLLPLLSSLKPKPLDPRRTSASSSSTRCAVGMTSRSSSAARAMILYISSIVARVMPTRSGLVSALRSSHVFAPLSHRLPRHL